MIPWECPHSTFLFGFTCFERVTRNKIASLGLLTFKVSMMFYTLGDSAKSENWLPGSAHIQCFYYVCHALRECWETNWFPGSAHMQCFYGVYTFWKNAGCQHRFRGNAHIQRFFCDLHALRECQVTKLIPWEYQIQHVYCVWQALKGCQDSELIA